MLGRRGKPADEVPVQALPIWLLPNEGSFEADNGEITYKGFDPFFDSECLRPLLLDQSQPGEPHIFYCRAVGVTHHPGDLQRPAFDVAAGIYLIPEPDNPVDPNAIAVKGLAGNAPLTAGYVPRNVAQLLHPMIGEGGNGIVLKTFSQHGRRIALRILGTTKGRPLDVQSVNQ